MTAALQQLGSIAVVDVARTALPDAHRGHTWSITFSRVRRRNQQALFIDAPSASSTATAGGSGYPAGAGATTATVALSHVGGTLTPSSKTGSITVTFLGGVAVFSGLQIDTAGSYVVLKFATASSPRAHAVGGSGGGYDAASRTVVSSFELLAACSDEERGRVLRQFVRARAACRTTRARSRSRARRAAATSPRTPGACPRRARASTSSCCRRT